MKTIAFGIGVFVGIFLFAATSHAAPPTVDSSGGWYEGSGASFTRSLTIDQAKLLVYVEKPDGDSVTVTWNGDSLTSFFNTGAGGRGLQGFQLSNPDQGTHDLVLTTDGTGNFAWAYIELDGTSEAMSAATVGTSSATTAITITDALGDPSADELEISAAICNNPIANITVTGGNTKLLQVSASNDGGEVLVTGADKDSIFTNGATACTWAAGTAQIASTPEPGCELDSATSAATLTGDQTIHAVGSCQGIEPTTAWIGAVRIDPIGAHIAWSEGYGPFPDPYTLDTADLPPQVLSNGVYRVRMYAKVGTTLYTSANYVDVTLDGKPWEYLTVGNVPLDEWELGEDDAPILPGTTGTGYTFSASTAAIAAGQGLRIDAEGCAVIGEDATSTTCVFAAQLDFLERNFPLLTWPLGIFDAFYDAYQVFDATATPATRIALDAHGNWIPAVVLVDSASSGAGIGQWINAERQAFFYQVMEFSLWVAFIATMYRKSQQLL